MLRAEVRTMDGRFWDPTLTLAMLGREGNLRARRAAQGALARARRAGAAVAARPAGIPPAAAPR
jgi:hypothetical protein